jgi:hypothetical protein
LFEVRYGGFQVSSPEPLERDAYSRAILEADPMKIADRIDEAKTAIRLRANELFLAPGDHIFANSNGS